MNWMIYFPHLGIHLKHVGKALSIFGFDIAYYGMIIGFAMLIGIFIAAGEAKRTHQNQEHYFDLAIYAIIFSIIGARLYYVIFSWDYYKGHLLSIFNLREGGLAIYGGVIAGVITVFVFASIKRLSAKKLLDTVCLGLVAGQMIGRWGNFFNREAFGEYTNGLFAMQLPINSVRASDITEKMRENIVSIDGVSFIQVHPTFLYESLWCLLILIMLFLYRKKKKFDGEVFLMYLFLYALGRVWIEGLRTDQLCLPGIGWPVSQVLAALLVILSPVLIVMGRRRAERERRNRRRRSRASVQESVKEYDRSKKVTAGNRDGDNHEEE